MKNVICNITLGAGALFLFGLGTLIVNMINAASPDSECEFCEKWGRTYTDEKGREHSFCENCADNPNHEKDS